VSDVVTLPPAGRLLREWRIRRHLSQLELAAGSAVSARHLSFIETGRARPSREMVLHLADRLEVPLRERNRLLLAAGHAPSFAERPLDDEEMGPMREALDRFLAAHEPYPAVVVDRHWDLVRANRAVALLTDGVAAELLEPPANALRVTLHPDGMAPRIVNFAEWSGHLLRRLHRQMVLTGDRELEALYDELAGYPGVERAGSSSDVPAAAEIVLPLQLRRDGAELALFSTMTVFGTALDITLAELAIEAFYPANGETARTLAAHGAELGSRPTADRPGTEGRPAN
jgi:transcriptional regulator with XRE-family HTH domain